MALSSVMITGHNRQSHTNWYLITREKHVMIMLIHLHYVKYSNKKHSFMRGLISLTLNKCLFDRVKVL